MPSLDWIGKRAVKQHAGDVPFRLLKDVGELGSGDPGTGNLLVEGDNLQALKALLPYYSGQVKCIYIDPPYNTGTDERDADGKRNGWVYNDNLSSPEITAWLGRVVGPEAEDLSRHDKWLCMMYPRVALLRRFLRDDGVIFVSIDDIELGNLRALLDEVFGVTNRVGTIIWKNTTDNNPTRVVVEHEYVLCYAKDAKKLAPEWKSQSLAVKQHLLDLGNQFISEYASAEERQEAYSGWFRKNKTQLWPFDRYKFIDQGGIYTGSQSVHNPGKEGYRYDVLHPVTGKPCQQPLMGYRFPPDTMETLVKSGRILFGEDESKIVELKVYVRDYRAKLASVFELDGRIGTNEVKEIFPESKRPFDFPKPTALIEELLSFTTTGNDLVLDAFAGSGTTGHAVLKLNRADGQSRRFIAIEMNSSIARTITRERIHRVATGYRNSRREDVEALGGGFRFCTLGEPLANADGGLNPSVSFGDLARHVYFTETGEPLPRSRVPSTPLLGVHNDAAVYLLYNGILGDKSAAGGNVLTRAILASLPQHDGPRIIYCAGHRLGPDRLRQERVIVRQTPWSIRVR